MRDPYVGKLFGNLPESDKKFSNAAELSKKLDSMNLEELSGLKIDVYEKLSPPNGLLGLLSRKLYNHWLAT